MGDGQIVAVGATAALSASSWSGDCERATGTESLRLGLAPARSVGQQRARSARETGA